MSVQGLRGSLSDGKTKEMYQPLYEVCLACGVPAMQPMWRCAKGGVGGIARRGGDARGTPGEPWQLASPAREDVETSLEMMLDRVRR